MERVSPALHFNAELERSAYLLNTELTAVYSGFPRLQLTEGVIYPDSSNMPYLLLNEAAAKVVRSLGLYHLTAMYDSNSNMAWDLLLQQAIQSAVSGVLIVICAAALMDEKGRRESQQRKIETAALQVCGMTSRETDRILPIRVFFAEWGCLIISIAIAMGSGIFSALAAALCIIASIAILFYLTGRS